jgi:hypothetical protein
MAYLNVITVVNHLIRNISNEHTRLSIIRIWNRFRLGLDVNSFRKVDIIIIGFRDQYQNGIPADIETLRSSYLNEMISEESRNERRRLTKPKQFHEETMDSGDENEDQAELDSDWTPDSEQNIGNYIRLL